jgi:arginine/ornithine N-succinyltransferase beta subunit
MAYWETYVRGLVAIQVAVGVLQAFLTYWCVTMVRQSLAREKIWRDLLANRLFGPPQ